jgi:hypothetical protein
MDTPVSRGNKKESIFTKIFNTMPVCESARYLTVWSVLTAIIYLIIDVIIEKKIKASAYKLYRSTPAFYQKYEFNLFLDHVYSILGYSKVYKYIKFGLEIFLLPLVIYFYNYACKRNMEYINYFILVLYLLIFMVKMDTLFNTTSHVNDEVNKSYM